MVVNTPQTVSRIVSDGQQAYRDAVAAQIEGKNPTEFWDRWEIDTAALLLISWAEGATNTLRQAGVPMSAPEQVRVSQFAKLDSTVRVGNVAQEVAFRFKGGPAREVVERYVNLLPLTRERWDALVSYAFQAAGEMRDDESANALERILERSPKLRAVVQSTPQPVKPDAPDMVKIRRTPEVQAAVQGSFFVTGMTQEQVEETRDLLAKTVRGDVTMSVAGKKLETLGVGDFVEQATLQTGTDLTQARLETVYRTNLNRAQTQGRLDICRDSTVKKFVPLLMFRATRDKRTRETHKAMDGFVATTEQIDSMGIPAPLGFNCRCSWSPVSIAKAFAKGWCDEDGNPNYDAIRSHNGNRQQLIDKGLVPDNGFISG
jgi:SPP1 gp7 family putative phage head morphogenesis protein